MNKLVHSALLAFALLAAGCRGERPEPMSAVVERGFAVARDQALLLARTVEDQEGRLPRTFEGGEVKTSDYRAWISGFFPGVLWYLYENAPSDTLRRYAELYTARVEPAKLITTNHDLGFMLYCSFGNGYRLTGNPAYAEVMKTGAASLATRFNADIGAIQSWQTNEKWQFPVIIDNMMNLEFLAFAARETGDTTYLRIADTHARTTMEHHFRDDFSTWHVVSYDTLTFAPHAKNTHQGYADSSAWARGQAWALYGYTMMYRETGREEYLALARNIARYLTGHPRMPADKVPYWDFDAPDIPASERDASSAAIMASALVELSGLDKSEEAPRWLDYAQQQVRSLSSPAYLAAPGTNGGFILLHSVGNHNRGSEVDVPLSYADYYYLEALTRLKNLNDEQ